MNVLNGCAWRGGKLQISQAKPNRFRTLENGSIAIINEDGDEKKQKKKPKKKRKLVRMAGDQSLVTDKNVDKRKGWRRGRYGRAIACLRIRKPNRQLLVIDPSHYKNNLEKLFGSVKPKPLSQLLWTITDIKESESEDIEMDIVEAAESVQSESVQSESSNIDEIVDIEMEDSPTEFEPIEELAVEPELIPVVSEPVSLQEPIEEVEVCSQQEPEAESPSEALPDVKSSNEALPDVKSSNEASASPIPKAQTIPVPESKFEVNVNWSSLFTPSTNDSAPLFGSSISNKLKNSVPAEELFKKSVPEIEKEKEIINNINESSESAEAALTLVNKKQAPHNYASLFGDLNRITPTTATRFGMLLSQKEDMLHEWRIERIELKEDFKKRLAEGKRRNRRNKVNN